MDGVKTIFLISSDGKKLETNENAIKKSLLLKNTLNDYPDHAEIPLKNVKSEILKKIIEYLEHYENEEPKEIPKPLPDNNFEKHVDKWDYDFINLDLETISEIIISANHMDIKPLLELASAKVASIIRVYDKKKIREEFHISNDLKPKEEEELINEETWSMELL